MLLPPAAFGRIGTIIETVLFATCLRRIFPSLVPPLRPGLPAYIVELAGARDALLDGPCAFTDRHAGAEEVPVVQATAGGPERISLVAEVAGPEPLEGLWRWGNGAFDGRGWRERSD